MKKKKKVNPSSEISCEGKHSQEKFKGGKWGGEKKEVCKVAWVQMFGEMKEGQKAQ
jgi:hypothetical protein